MIGIIDYGMGNLHSVSKALERLGVAYVVSSDQAVLQQAAGLILPGVGSFHDAMQSLQLQGLDSFILEWAQAEKPLLGICLGMQLLFKTSEEQGPTRGLALLEGQVKRFAGVSADGTRYKVPHMGWNQLSFAQQEHPLLQNVADDYVYFVHSYVVTATNKEQVLATSFYHETVPAVVGHRNTFGMQFHPEKSGVLGMSLLRNFCTLVEQGVVQHG